MTYKEAYSLHKEAAGRRHARPAQPQQMRQPVNGTVKAPAQQQTYTVPSNVVTADIMKPPKPPQVPGVDMSRAIGIEALRPGWKPAPAPKPIRRGTIR